MAATRVHILAKELNVKSKAIVEKCQAEGLDVKNHMSTISAGLAATIREWFSEGEHTTTVETAERVDLKKVKLKKKTKKKTKKEEAPPVEEVPETPEQPEETVEKEIPEEPEPQRPVAVPFEPPKPSAEDLTPAGPMLEKPKPVKLNGPKVIRVEEPEKVETPRPRGRGKAKPSAPRPPRPTRPAKPDYDQIISTPLMENVVAEPKQGKGKKGKKGKSAYEQEEDRGIRSKRMRERDLEERRARLLAADGGGLRGRPSRKIASKKDKESTVEHKRPEKATITEPITVKDLSAAIGVKVSDIMTTLISQGTMATANQVIPIDVAELVSLEFGVELSIEEKVSLEDEIEKQFEDRERKNLTRRPPVVTMLGHVDHGKTSLLDRIRESKVAAGEAGGITQHIGAYQITWGEKKVTFLDTPGHEAFTAMRARGANMTDIVVLVVAADDGVMPQTVEAIHHAKAAGVKIIVALNKIDLPGVDVNRVYGQLAEHELVPTEWGGEVEVVKTSAETGEGVDELLEYLDYTSELLEMKADPSIPATGWVVESKMTQSHGPVATLLIKEGNLNKSDTILVGESYGRIRTMVNSYGKAISKAQSSMPVEISGLNTVPVAGDKFYTLDDINKAKEAADQQAARNREKALSRRQLVTLDNLFSQIEAGNVKELNLVLKADVQGSVDVLIKYLNELSTDEVKIKILHAAVGGITEGDVILAQASNAIIIGFNVVANESVKKIAEDEEVDIRTYTIIYRITEDLKKAMAGLLEPEEQENQLGRLTVRQIFKITGVGAIAGCFVTSGIIKRSANVRLIRDDVIIYDNGSIDSLKHLKDDVREVKNGFECGIKIANYDDIKVDDVIEAYEVVKVAREL